MIVVIDNFDSFTYNIVNVYRGLDSVLVLRNDSLDEYNFDDLVQKNPLIVISPGPRNPEETPTLVKFIEAYARKFAIFGVCLGAQLIGHHFGAKITRASSMFHGKLSDIYHSGQGVFRGLPVPLVQTRYHSLLISPENLPACLEVTARTNKAEIMGIAHSELPIEGVQFHPESIASVHGTELLKNSLLLRNFYKQETSASLSSTLNNNFTEQPKGVQTPTVTKELNIRSAIDLLLQNHRLSAGQAYKSMEYMSDSDSDRVLSAMFLTALKIRGENSDVVLGFAQALRDFAYKLRPEFKVSQKVILDVVGTGGDKHNTINISTGVALLLSAMGVTIIKHGNKAVSSKSGSADVLSALGLDINRDPEQVYNSYKKTNFAFLYAPLYHSALKNIAPVRATMKIPTIFNILGPLVNPAQPSHILLGVYSYELQNLMAEAVSKLAFARAAIVCSSEQADELTLSGPNRVIEINNGARTEYLIDPQELGLSNHPMTAITGGDALYNAKVLKNVFAGENLPTADEADEVKGIQIRAVIDTLCLNAGMALYLVDKVTTVSQGIVLAQKCIDSGAVLGHIDAITANPESV